MAEAIHVPRINNNDDEVKLVALQVVIGGRVAKGDVVAQVETDKAVVDVEAGSDGFIIAILATADETVKVGSVLIWLGKTTEDAVPSPQLPKPSANANAGSLNAEPTAKARALLLQYGLDSSAVPASGDRLSVADIEFFMAAKDAPSKAKGPAMPSIEALPEAAGELKALKSEDRGMLATVVWHRDVAVPGYIEIGYDAAPWAAYAAEFGQKHGLLLSPLLPLMAWRLVELARDNARLNATIVGSKRYEYSQVNLGSTVQVGEVLYLAVVRDSDRLGELGFVNAMVDLQRRAAGHKLGPDETRGTTVGFSSMARWKVARHIPILSPHTSMMVAHTVGSDGAAVLGATYDHRVMGGSDVASALRKLSRPGATI
jgi:pyruvate dehydrogenase E2 component (dihydrolipoamide acetyltransferase)